MLIVLAVPVVVIPQQALVAVKQWRCASVERLRAPTDCTGTELLVVPPAFSFPSPAPAARTVCRLQPGGECLPVGG